MTSSLVIDNDPIANVSQDYIENLMAKKKRAANALSIADSHRTAAAKAQTDTQVWKVQIEGYWKSVLDTNTKYKGIEKDIISLKARSEVVTSNADAVAEAIEILVCIVCQMSNKTEEIKDNLKSITTKIKGVDSNEYTKLLTDFETQLEEAIKTNNATIQKILDVLTTTYRLHISILGEKRISGIRFPIDEKYLHLNLKGPDIDLTEFFEKNRGLKANLNALLGIFTGGNPYIIANDPDALCPVPIETDAIHFALDKYNNPYFVQTREQFIEAEAKLDMANERLSLAQDIYNARKTADDALKLSLDAAQAAKSSTK